ncbi:MAG TPA: M48 family metallopeptidase [Paludibacteraceae bacterium]|nr:M48 family metallopeptidase [Paludibacteraceae bacterium]
MKKYLLLGTVLLVLVGCSTVALTGRKQLMLVSDAEILEASNLHYTEFMSTAKVSTNAAATKQIKQIGANIAKAVETYLKENGREADIASFAWDFTLVQDTTINAFCLPGGKVVFYEGILPICANETGLAVVMGHEIAHAVAKHGNERMSQQILAQTGLSVAGVALSGKSEQAQQLMSSVYGLGVNYGVILPYSRKHEYEADRLGMIFMAMAGYDPAGAVAFWERMTAGKESSVPEFLSTHPSDTKRIQAMQNVLPEAQGYYKK